VERVLDVGEILIAYGDFLENNHPLVPAGYCEEWWLLDQKPGDKTAAGRGGGPGPCKGDRQLSPPCMDMVLGRYLLRPDPAPCRYGSTGRKIEEDSLVLPLSPEIKDPLEILLIPS